jgi:hypothetical protein
LFQISDCNKISGVGKLIKIETNMSEIAFPKFGHLLYQNRISIKDRNSGRICNPFPTWIKVSISYLDKKTQETIFSGIPMASRTCVLPINRPLSFKRRCAWCLGLGLVLSFRQNSSWRLDKLKRRRTWQEAIPALRWAAKFLIGCWCGPFQVTMV